MNALNELKKWMIENNDDDTPLHPSDIYKKIDELIASQPSGGKSAEDCLQDFGCPEVPFDENVTMYYPAIIESAYGAMEEYASQYANQQPVNDGWVRFVNEYIEAWDNGMPGDLSLYNKAKSLIEPPKQTL